MSSISIYAEFLTNIHQVSVFINLPSISDGDTTVNLSHNRRAVIVNHRGAQRILQLPCQVVEGSSLTLPPTGYQEISLRFQAAAEVCSPQKRNETSGDDVPWPASSLTPETKIACGSCKSVLVDRAIQKWKDLPRENWAEMMDFWHCHKPDPEESQELRNHSLKKGYTASNKLIPSQGVGLVDNTHFHFLWSNCIGIKVYTLFVP